MRKQLNIKKEQLVYHKNIIAFTLVDILVEINIEKNPEYIANLYTALSTYQQKNNDIEGYIDSLDKVTVSKYKRINEIG